MYASEFEYVAPSSLEEVLSVLAERPEARVLAGGQSLIPLLKLRLAAPGVLVDLRRVEALHGIREVEGGVELGALVTYREAARSPFLRDAARALAEAAAAVGDPQVRAVGTVCGGIAHADPAADVPAAILALDATLVARGPAGRREIPASAFFLAPWTTALEPGEILAAVRVAVAAGSGGAYEKLAHPASGFALVGAAAVAAGPEKGARTVRVGLAGVAGTPVPLEGLDAVAAGDPEEVARACRAAAERLADPPSDLHASGDYRRAMAAVLARRAVLRAVA